MSIDFSSSSRSSTPHVNAPCEPPPWRASATLRRIGGEFFLAMVCFLYACCRFGTTCRGTSDAWSIVRPLPDTGDDFPFQLGPLRCVLLADPVFAGTRAQAGQATYSRPRSLPPKLPRSRPSWPHLPPSRSVASPRRPHQPRSAQLTPRNGSDKSRAVAFCIASACFIRYALAAFSASRESATRFSGWSCTYVSYSFGPPT